MKVRFADKVRANAKAELIRQEYRALERIHLSWLQRFYLNTGILRRIKKHVIKAAASGVSHLFFTTRDISLHKPLRDTECAYVMGKLRELGFQHPVYLEEETIQDYYNRNLVPQIQIFVCWDWDAAKHELYDSYRKYRISSSPQGKLLIFKELKEEPGDLLNQIEQSVWEKR